MRTDYQRKSSLAKDQEVFIGIDVHKESWQVTIRAEGEEVFHSRLPSQYQALEKLVERLPGCTVKVAYELDVP
jgi:hypothetical protein